MACTNKEIASSCTNPGYANTGGSMAMAVLGHVQLHTMAMPTEVRCHTSAKILICALLLKPEALL